MTHAGSRRGLAALSVTGVLWGSIGIAIRVQQNHGSSPSAITFWRFVTASVVLLAVLGPSGLRGMRIYLRRPWRLLAVSVASLTFQLLYAFAVKDVGVAVATLITLGLAPVALTVVESLQLRSVPTARTTWVLLGALAGLALVTSGGGEGLAVAPHATRGVIESVSSGLFYAAGTMMSGRLSTRLRPVAITFATSVVAVVAMVPAVAATGWYVPHSAVTVTGTLWLGIVTTVVAYGLFYAGLRTTPSNIALVLTLLEPVTAVVLAAILLDEPLTVANVVGGALLLVAVATLYLSPRPRELVEEATDVPVRNYRQGMRHDDD